MTVTLGFAKAINVPPNHAEQRDSFCNLYIIDMIMFLGAVVGTVLCSNSGYIVL